MTERCRVASHDWEPIPIDFDNVVKAVCRKCGDMGLKHDCTENSDALYERFPDYHAMAITPEMRFSKGEPMWIIEGSEYYDNLISHCPFCGLDLYAASDAILKQDDTNGE